MKGISPPTMSAPTAPFALRLLVVEDSDTDYELLLAHLKRQGFAVTATRVQSAAEMEAALEAGGFEFVLSDYNVPGFGAVPALEMLKARGSDLPFVLVSGMIREEDAAEAMRAGAEDWVPKDRMARLAPAIHRGLEAAAARRHRREAQAALTAVAANLPGMLFRIATGGDPMLRFEYASEGARELFGVEPERIVEDAGTALCAFHEADRAALVARLRNSPARGTLRGEYRLRAPDGSERWVHVGATAHDPGTRPGWDGVMTDITMLKEAEARLIEQQEQLRSLSAHLERAKEAERAEIAREIHDDLGGTLTALKVELAGLERKVNPASVEAVQRVARLVESAQRSCQAIARALRPSALDQGLYPALAYATREFAARHGLVVKLDANDQDLGLDLEVATALFRICQEGLTNIAKHAAAQTVEVTLFANEREVTLEIHDDGRGVDPANLDKTGSFGVFGMHERVRNLGGWLEVSGAPGRGTTLMVSLPRRRPQAPG